MTNNKREFVVENYKNKDGKYIIKKVHKIDHEGHDEDIIETNKRQNAVSNDPEHITETSKRQKVISNDPKHISDILCHAEMLSFVNKAMEDTYHKQFDTQRNIPWKKLNTQCIDWGFYIPRPVPDINNNDNVWTEASTWEDSINATTDLNPTTWNTSTLQTMFKDIKQNGIKIYFK